METRESVLYNSILKSSLEREDVKELEREMSRDFYEVYQDLQKSHDHYKIRLFKNVKNYENMYNFKRLLSR